MKRINWSRALESMVLIRIGQDLGHDSKLARAVHDLIDLFASVAGGLFS